MPNNNNSSPAFSYFNNFFRPFYYQITVNFFLPISIPTGIMSCLLTIIILPSSSVRINSRCRYLYLFYTASESFLIFFKDIHEGYLPDGIEWITGGNIFLSLEAISSLFCKVFRGLRFSTEALAAY